MPQLDSWQVEILYEIKCYLNDIVKDSNYSIQNITTLASMAKCAETIDAYLNSILPNIPLDFISECKHIILRRCGLSRRKYRAYSMYYARINRESQLVREINKTLSYDELNAKSNYLMKRYFNLEK